MVQLCESILCIKHSSVHLYWTVPRIRRLHSSPSVFCPPHVAFSRVSEKQEGRKEEKIAKPDRPRGDLASCYFCIPVNRVGNPICLFATASKLPSSIPTPSFFLPFPLSPFSSPLFHAFLLGLPDGFSLPDGGKIHCKVIFS